MYRVYRVARRAAPRSHSPSTIHPWAEFIHARPILDYFVRVLYFVRAKNLRILFFDVRMRNLVHSRYACAHSDPGLAWSRAGGYLETNVQI